MTISNGRTGDDYLSWITAEGQSVTLNQCTLNNTKTDGTTRGIAIKDQYCINPQIVNPTVSNTTFDTTAKAVVLVTNSAVANIVWGEGNDISAVSVDNINAVLVDEERSSSYDTVTVTGATKINEPTTAGESDSV